MDSTDALPALGGSLAFAHNLTGGDLLGHTSRASLPAQFAPEVHSDDDDVGNFCVRGNEPIASRALRSKSALVRKAAARKHDLVVTAMQDAESANDSDSVDSIIVVLNNAVSALPANEIVELLDTTITPTTVVVVAAEDGSEPRTPDISVLTLHQQLTALQSDHFGMDRFSLEDKMQLELLHILKSHRLPLNTFAPTLEFAIKLNSLGISLVHAPKTRKTIISKLFKHYNMGALAPLQKACFLPIAKASVNVVFFNARAVFASLLSCPYLNQEHKYMFHDPTNIFAPPPDTNVIGEMNTGAIFRATYHKLVIDPFKDMLFPVVFGLDKTHIDASSRLQMEPLTISYGLLKLEYRCQPSAMRILGYINLLPVHYQASRLPMAGKSRMSVGAAKLNDYHAQIEFILHESGFLQLQEQGFAWNLHFGGNVYPVIFRVYVPFIVGDTEGHDRLCGHYTARFMEIQQLCRICKCPTSLSSYSKGVYKKRYPNELQDLLAVQNDAGFRAISQTYLLRNGFANVRFGSRQSLSTRVKPDRGIFGACPGEILHLILLGWFRYCMEAFVIQMGGPKTTSAALFDDLCADIGLRLQRQSDREVPRTNFPKGFSTGANLKGHEMVGCLVVMLFAIQTSQFQSMFAAPRYAGKGKLGNSQHIADWIMLLESLLQWHQWLKEPTMTKFVVSRSKKTMRWLMRHFQKIAPREAGMQYNTVKMHLVLHLAEDIVDHGVPQNVNSAFTESAHIPLAKDTSRNTQKRGTSFTYQAAKRYVENLALELAFYETGNQLLNVPQPDAAEKNERASGLYFAFSRVCVTAGNEIVYQWHSTTRQQEQLSGLFKHSGRLTAFLQSRILSHLPVGFQLPCYTDFATPLGKDGKYQVYRAHPHYQQKPWYDCALIKWTVESEEKPGVLVEVDLPARLYAFVDLRCPELCAALNQCSDVKVEDPVEPDLYAICESYDRAPAIIVDNEETTATIVGIFHRTETATSDPTLYLVSTKCIIEPMYGMRDIASKHLNKASTKMIPAAARSPYYLFFVKPRHMWAQCWEDRICGNNDKDEEGESPEEGDKIERRSK